MLPLRNLLISRTSDIAFANFSDRPACLFNGVHQKLSIMFAKCKTAKKKMIVKFIVLGITIGTRKSRIVC